MKPTLLAGDKDHSFQFSNANTSSTFFVKLASKEFAPKSFISKKAAAVAFVVSSKDKAKICVPLSFFSVLGNNETVCSRRLKIVSFLYNVVFSAMNNSYVDSGLPFYLRILGLR